MLLREGKGVSAINITLSNESDALPASPEGVVSDYSGSGTTIRVFEGSQELSYGTGNGKYQVVASGSNISPNPTPTTNGNARVYGNASSMGTAATAVITFVVSGKTFDGVSFSFDKVQSFTKSERGGDGEDGITISQNQQGYTYRADLNGGYNRVACQWHGGTHYNEWFDTDNVLIIHQRWNSNNKWHIQGYKNSR